MGSLSSRPKVPSYATQPRVVYMPAPEPLDPMPLPSPAPSSPDDDSAFDADQAESTIRVENLLRRNRGRSGTILTGFRGILSPNELVPRRKTLLGE